MTPSQEYVCRLAAAGADIWGIAPELVFQRTGNTRRPAAVRKAIWLVLRERGWKLDRIQRVFSRDHSTIVNQVAKAMRARRTDADFAYMVRQMLQVEDPSANS